MTVGDILREKGQHVVSIWPEHTVGDAIRTCAEQNISAVVITDHDSHPIGIISDRDALRCLAKFGLKGMSARVTDIMQSPPPRCGPEDTVTDLLKRMTYDRYRHAVVAHDGRMIGLVSIGDLVKSKLRDADLESRVLRERALSRLAAE